MGTKLLTYATSAIETAMRDCAVQGSFSLSLPLDRYRQLRQVAFLYATHERDVETDLLPAIQEKLTVSAKVARRLLEEYRTVFHIESLGEGVFDLGYGGDPARAYDLSLIHILLITIMSSLAQEESRSISENVTWGQRKRFADGKVSLPYSHFLGYRKGDNGLPEIVPEEAETVRWIYSLFLSGKTTGSIASLLTREGIPTPAGKKKWAASTVESILDVYKRQVQYLGVL